MPPRSRLAPTTATTRGSKNARIDAVAAICARSADRCGESRRDFERELATVETGLGPAFDLEARVVEDPDHLAVLAGGVRVEEANALGARHLGQSLEETRADAAALERVGDHERHFGALGAGSAACNRRRRRSGLRTHRPARGRESGRAGISRAMAASSSLGEPRKRK